MENDLKYWNALNQNLKIGPVKFKKLSQHFDTMEHAWNANIPELQKAGFDRKTIEYFSVKRKEINPDQEWEKLYNENIRLLTINNDSYPKILHEIYNPPALLYIKGAFSKLDELSIGVVGTRKLSDYGKQVTPDIVRELAQNKITIISGLALGVDSSAHYTALRNNGRTIAVLGTGIDDKSIYPYANKKLASEIIENGAVISEYPMGTMPLRQNFPARNRIISGLSLGTLVIEAPESSGALITAKFALEQNREVFAIPGSIYNQNSIGPNNLIKMGAKLVVGAADILEELNLNQATEFAKNKEIVPDTKEEEVILKYLSKEPVHIDKVVHLSGLPAPTVSSTMILMEMKGQIRNLGGMLYVIS